MSGLQSLKTLIGTLTDIGLMLLALAIVVALLFGSNAIFVPNPIGNIVGMVSELGKAGLAGLIALGVILWLFSNRSVS